MPASSYTGRNPGLRIRVAPEEVAFWHWPLRDRGVGAWIDLALVAVAVGAVYWLTRSGAMTGLTLVALLLAAWRSWLPVWFELGPGGVTQEALGLRRRLAWSAIQHHHVARHGVLLLTDAAPTRLSPLRGLYLYWGNRRGQVLANIEYYLQSWSSDRSHTGRESTQFMRRPTA